MHPSALLSVFVGFRVGLSFVIYFGDEYRSLERE
jgi:hypothetical protein